MTEYTRDEDGVVPYQEPLRSCPLEIICQHGWIDHGDFLEPPACPLRDSLDDGSITPEVCMTIKYTIYEFLSWRGLHGQKRS